MAGAVAGAAVLHRFAATIASQLRRGTAYAIGSLAAWWCLERVAAFWA